MDQDIRDAVELVLCSVNTVEGDDKKELFTGIALINGAAARRTRLELDAEATDDYDPGDPPQERA